MIELYLAIMLFGVGTYFGRNTKRPVLKSIDKNTILNIDNNNNNNKKKDLVVYSKSDKQSVIDLEKEYGKRLDQKCREILPRDFNGLLNEKSMKTYENRKLAEIDYQAETVDNEILKYKPKNNNFVKSNLTGTDIPMEQFTKSTAIGKDNKGQDLTTNTWALPYFGGKATQPMKTEAFQNKLETFTGSSQFNFHKKEIKPLFVPNKNVSFVNGTPIYNDEVKNRFNQSNYRNTELPFEQQRVGRGVGQNYGNKGVGGFHQYEIQELARPKSVDELRTISNPKVTYKQPIISGKSFNDKRGATINISK